MCEPFGIAGQRAVCRVGLAHIGVQVQFVDADDAVQPFGLVGQGDLCRLPVEQTARQNVPLALVLPVQAAFPFAGKTRFLAAALQGGELEIVQAHTGVALPVETAVKREHDWGVVQAAVVQVELDFVAVGALFVKLCLRGAQCAANLTVVRCGIDGGGEVFEQGLLFFVAVGQLVDGGAQMGLVLFAIRRDADVFGR